MRFLPLASLDYSYRRDRGERSVLYGKRLRANLRSSSWNTVYIVRETGNSMTSSTSPLCDLCVLGGELSGLARDRVAGAMRDDKFLHGQIDGRSAGFDGDVRSQKITLLGLQLFASNTFQAAL